MLTLAEPAHATVGSCGSADAPSSPYSYNTASCSSVCTESGSELECNLASLCGSDPADATMVTNFGSSTHDVSAWGHCGAGPTLFCCVFDEGATAIDTVTLRGTVGNDDPLNFTYDFGGANERNMEPWDSDPIEGFIIGGLGSDEIHGSIDNGMDYSETLIGGAGGDSISGHGGRDLIKGQEGNDILRGGDHADILWGGDGDDSLYGGGANDTLCDSAGFSTCASVEGNAMDGGGGDDKLWYTCPSDGSCSTSVIYSSSTAGDETTDDYCGDDNCWSYPLEYPNDCEITVTVEPPKCVGQN